MKHGIVMFSETGDRWDAGFHLLRTELAPRTAELEESVSAEDALARLDRIPLRFKNPLLQLGWGSAPRTLNARTVAAIQDKYPHLCLALMERARDETVATLRAEVSRTEDTILDLLDLTTPSDQVPVADVHESAQIPSEASFQAGWIYPLLDPDRYHDEDDAERYDLDEGRRFSYVRVPTDSDPGDCYIADLWIVDDEGNHHPGYDACPVPIRKDDVDMERGRPMSGSTRRARGVFESDWLRR